MEKAIQITQTIQPVAGEGRCGAMKDAGTPAGFHDELRHQIDTQRPQQMARPVPSTSQGNRRGLIHVGTISQENPTVSHLLISHPDFNKDCWGIIHSDINARKPFRSLCEGEEIFIHPATGELVWGGVHAALDDASPGEVIASERSELPVPSPKSISPPVRVRTVAGVGHTDMDGDTLATVLKPYIGTPYERLDCYQLVVAGLKGIGIQYGGQGGLQHHLIHTAAREGLPTNAYLTGNGLIEAASTMVFDRTITHEEGTAHRTDRVWEELVSLLEEGLIVSFSAGGKGHTGVVSRYGDRWTFLNSGDMDHDVRSHHRRKGVGEEDFRSEIANWLRRAARKGEPLRMTLGRLNRDKLASFLGRRSYSRSV